eukprot:gb/GEZN01013230.1/.p1 GENE.gb/GEZN01013230.1/~~gb/GEZN01013230.1/.p1  ORF type:complete len:301 (-),score=22.91 gb/GEZN01013230.1/:103-1005(-)
MQLQPSKLASILACAFLAMSYVGSLYVWKDSSRTNRDDPSVIKRRFLSVTMASCLSPFILLLFDHSNDTASYSGDGPSLLTLIGIRFPGFLVALWLPLFLTSLLFSGTIYLLCLNGMLRPSVLTRSLSATWQDSQKLLIFLRNYLVGPLSEEVVFRGVMLPLLVSAKWGFAVQLLASPLFFGLAHLHHLFNLVRSMHYTTQQAMFVVAFQLFYTTVFGLYASFLFLRTGQLVAPVLSHIFCNFMGFPELGWISDDSHYAYFYRKSVAFVYMLGIIIFIANLMFLTEPALYHHYNLTPQTQ